MIRYLHLTNFRRHVDTELHFDDGGQIILISGRNGVGKSTIIESIVYALYGEGRHGNRQIDRMIRRGAEIEGMEVELEFDLGGTNYRVRRRRDNKLSSAILYGNDVALVEGPREVSAEIAHLLGMDVRGFRLAVVAQQKELDGLASMRPAERAQLLARLLRLDVVTQARDRARGVFRSERDALRGLGTVESPQALRDEIAGLDEELVGLRAARSEAESAVSELDKFLEDTKDVVRVYQAQVSQQARLEGLATSAKEELGRLVAERAGIVLGEEPGELPDLDELAERVAGVERALAAGEANAKLVSQAAMVEGELAKVEKRLAELYAEAEGLEEYDEESGADAIGAATAAVTELAQRREELIGQRSSALAKVAAAEERLGELSALEATCALCGQEITPEHREKEASSVRATLEAAGAEVAGVNEQLESLASEQEEAKGLVEAARRADSEGRSRNERARALGAESTDLVRRRDTYRDQLSRLQVVPVDLEELYEQQSLLAAEAAAAKNVHEAARVRELVVERINTLDGAITQATTRARQSQEAYEGGAVDAAVERTHGEYQKAVVARSAELVLTGELAKQVAVTEERSTQLRKEAERLAAQSARRGELEHSAQVASECANVLDNVATRLNQQIRPALEGAVGELLSRLSDGRFDAVRLDEEYNLEVRDDGQMRPLNEFSGGEIDLIALAMRLALANVVSERHGSGGAGFLILDECFGSQDQDRRGSILTALRGLRGAYGQILLISHVGGIEDSADRVIEIELDEETGTASASAA